MPTSSVQLVEVAAFGGDLSIQGTAVLLSEPVDVEYGRSGQLIDGADVPSGVLK